MQIFKLNPENIICKENLPRLREEMGDLKSLAESFSKFGQIAPIVVTPSTTKEADKPLKYYLIAGERRLEACKILGIDANCVSKDSMDDVQMRELEIEENIKRKQFTPAEELKAIEELHNMKVKQHGKASAGADKSGWGATETAKILGISAGAVNDKLKLAKVMSAYPELGNLKNESDIRKAVKKIESVGRRAQAIHELKKRPSNQNKISGLLTIETGDANEFIRKQGNRIYNVVFTDPPYGIKIDKVQSTSSSKVGQFTFSDEFSDAIMLYHNLAKESFRVTKDNGYAVIFFAPELYEIIKRSFMEAGWITNHRPLIWVKGTSGQTNQPAMWPSNCYEMFFIFRKKDSRLIQEGQPDWIQCNIVTGEARLHPTEKPVELLRTILKRLCLPGHKLIDPFMGSGSSLEAGILEQLEVAGNDLAPECHDMAFSRLQRLKTDG